MIRMIALVGGLLLIAGPLWWLLDATIPVTRYRVGGFADYVFFTKCFIAIYGSVVIGVAVGWIRARRKRMSLFAIAVFQAGIYGAIAVSLVFFAGGIVYGLVVYGAFEKAIGGNLWGAFVILWWIGSAIVAVGIALVYYAAVGRMKAGGTSGRGPWGAPPT